MTFADDVRAVLDEDGGWMTAREIAAVLDSRSEKLVCGKSLHACLHHLAKMGQVEMDRPPDAPNRYYLVADKSMSRETLRHHRQDEYESAFPGGEFTASSLGCAMGVNRITASRHARRAVAEGKLSAEKRNGQVYYRRVEA